MKTSVVPKWVLSDVEAVRSGAEPEIEVLGVSHNSGRQAFRGRAAWSKVSVPALLAVFGQIVDVDGVEFRLPPVHLYETVDGVDLFIPGASPLRGQRRRKVAEVERVGAFLSVQTDVASKAGGPYVEDVVALLAVHDQQAAGVVDG